MASLLPDVNATNKKEIVPRVNTSIRYARKTSRKVSRVHRLSESKENRRISSEKQKSEAAKHTNSCEENRRITSEKQISEAAKHTNSCEENIRISSEKQKNEAAKHTNSCEEKIVATKSSVKNVTDSGL